MPPETAARNAAAGWRRPIWLALLVAASVAFSVGFACVTPFAAFAAAAALTLGRRDGVILMAAVWLANQAVGYVVLDYPLTADAVAWGGAIGGASLLALLAAGPAAHALSGGGRLVAALAALFFAWAVYEGALLVVAATVLGGTEDFTPTIVGEVLAVNAAALAGLFVLHWLGAAVGLAARPALPLGAAARRA